MAVCLTVVCLILALLLCGNGILADNNKYFHTTSLCLPATDKALYRRVDGAVVSSENELNLRCVVTFQTDSILQRFMLRFEHLALDCNDHLYIFDGAQEYGKFEHHLSCRSTRADVGTVFTQGNHLTLKYITDSRSHAGNGFRLVITAVKKPNTGCQTFRCLNDLCISRNLTCDGVNHCGDNSDETSQGNCADQNATQQILGVNFGTFVSLVLGIFLMCCVCIVAIIMCVFRRENQGAPRSVVLPSAPPPPQYPSMAPASCLPQPRGGGGAGEAPALRILPPPISCRGRGKGRGLLSCRVKQRPRPPKKEWLV